MGKNVGKATMATGGVLAATSAITTGLGFTTSGIAAGSIAAASQAAVGNVVVGSAFATAQSLGAAGVFAALGPIGIGVVAVGGVAYLLSGWFTLILIKFRISLKFILYNKLEK